MDNQPLAGRVVAIPETREVDVFAAMLERRGARVVRCPLVAIRDAPDPAPVLQWSRELASRSFDDLILLTGEGLHRILACIDRNEPPLREPFIGALAGVRKITRGPKPARALRELGLKTDIAAERPTTEGVIASLQAHDLKGRRFGVQLYGTDPNRPLVEFLESAGAKVSAVAPTYTPTPRKMRQCWISSRASRQGKWMPSHSPARPRSSGFLPSRRPRPSWPRSARPSLPR